MELLASSWTGCSKDEEDRNLYQYVFELKNIISESCEIAQDNIELSARQNKKYYDKKAKQRIFKVNDEVLVLLPSDTNKLLMMWRGPYQVVSVHGTDYKIDMEGKLKVFHANLLKKYFRRETITKAAVCEVPDTFVNPNEDCPNEANIVADDVIPFDLLLGHGICSQTSNAADKPVVVRDEQSYDFKTCFACLGAAAVIPDNTDSDQFPIPTISSGKQESVEDIVYDSSLPVHMKEELKKAFSSFPQALKVDPGELKTDLFHSIHLSSNVPIRVKQYPLPLTSKQAIEREVKSMLDLGVIEPSSSPYCSPVVLVSKKDGSVRFCIDFRALNKITEFDSEPIPDTDDLFARLATAEYFTKIDLSKGYWQILVDPVDRPKTAFQTPLGLFQWVRMPFGLVTAAATFARMMRLLELQKFSAHNFFDDIPVASENWQNHLQNVKSVMAQLTRRCRRLCLFPHPLQRNRFVLCWD